MGKTVLLSAGGTGGHLFPAQALAHELGRRGWTVYLATDGRAERFAGEFPARETFIIPSATFGGRNPVTLLKALWTIWRGVRETGRVIGQKKPDAVIGFGGYPTLPPVYAASRRKVPTIIHEQNAVMGRANKALAGLVNAVAGGFLPADSGSHADKTVITGNPVRPDVLEAAGRQYDSARPGKPFNLLVFGGSQGARFFSEAIPAAVELLPEELRSQLSIVQQARVEDEARVKQAYEHLGVRAEVSPFFSNMADRIANAHLVISRSGASTVSEISAIGRPAILVPYPYALDHDQAANAAALASVGGAEVHHQRTLDGPVIAEILSQAMAEPDRLSTMASAAKSVGRPDAVHLLADLVEAIASGQSVEQFKRGAVS